MNAFRALAFVSSLAIATAANAADFSVGTFFGNIPALDVSGPIFPGDQFKFENFAKSKSFTLVRLQSPGGDVAAALDIGNFISKKGYSTYVGSNKVCASACALVWLAGSHRAKDASAFVGLHAAYTQVDGKNIEYSVGNAVVGAYLANLHYDFKAIIFATSAGPEAMNWITPETGPNNDIAFVTLSDVQKPVRPIGSASIDPALTTPMALAGAISSPK